MMNAHAKIKELIRKYLTRCIKLQFNMDVDLNNEYTLTENIVSKKTIIARTFSDNILSKPSLKLFLTSLITEINNERCSLEFMTVKMKSMPKSA
ncbi:hypothetical protein SD427_10955 [Chryseobacterium sp. JJR-5R]|uniref:hypothetical protein n=1 Tax=Chryseobacterium sp. JJR-5R TaxID=3093923 RepID=UPI002A765703|nr:hypothetical protein [Chryseobacterium sp. JJR-5R]WPO81281.1 hypothetical protein SD427_10955 [Chryseobacterium sp. JJR-5R]